MYLQCQIWFKIYLR